MTQESVPYFPAFYYVLAAVIVFAILWLLTRKAIPTLGTTFLILAILCALVFLAAPIIVFFFQVAWILLGKYQPYIYFYAISLFILFCALQVATRRNLVHCALFLCLTFIGVAGIFILLNAEFIAIVQILIYAGAITVLMLFAIMLTQNLTGRELQSHNRQVPFTVIAALGLGILMIVIFLNPVRISETDVYGPSQKWAVQAGMEDMAVDVPNISLIGQSLMSTYTLAFWIASIILTVAMIGGLILARKD
jgi:NADH-quinone oxidoreductase subunit J